MKREKLEIRINKLINLIGDWCTRKKYEYCQSGSYSMYIKLSNFDHEEFRNELREFIHKEIGIGKKKLKKMLSILHMEKRTYILFKIDCPCT